MSDVRPDVWSERDTGLNVIKDGFESFPFDMRQIFSDTDSLVNNLTLAVVLVVFVNEPKIEFDVIQISGNSR